MDAHPPRLFACSNKIGRFVVSPAIIITSAFPSGQVPRSRGQSVIGAGETVLITQHRGKKEGAPRSPELALQLPRGGEGNTQGRENVLLMLFH